MATQLPASSRNCCDSRPTTAVHQRPSGRSRSPRIDPPTITSPALGPSTQISPGARGTIRPNPGRVHNHSPPHLTQAPVQISSSEPQQHGMTGPRPEHQPARGTYPVMLFRAARVAAWAPAVQRGQRRRCRSGSESELLGGANDVADAGVPQPAANSASIRVPALGVGGVSRAALVRLFLVL